MRLAFVLLQTLLVGLPALGAYAQSTLDAGSVVGVLRDRTGAVVQAGIIEIKGLDAGFARSTVSDAAGRYAFDAVHYKFITLDQLAEITREQLFLQLSQELPYSATVETDAWEQFDNGEAF